MLFTLRYQREVHVTNNHILCYDDLERFIKEVFSNLPNKFTLSYKDSNHDKICLIDQTDFNILAKTGKQMVEVSIFSEEKEKVEKIEDDEGLKSELGQRKIFNEVKKESDSFNQELSKISFKKSEIESNSDNDTIIFDPKNDDIVSKTSEFEILGELDKCQKIVHVNVACQECKAEPIIGVRYKCVICNSYDLCSQCEKKEQHKHPFLKIKLFDQTPVHLFAVIDDNNCMDVHEKSEVKEKEIEKKGFFGKIRQEKGEKIIGFFENLWGSKRKSNQESLNEKVKEPKEEAKSEIKLNGQKELRKYPSFQYKHKDSSQIILSLEDKNAECANYLCNVLNIEFEKALEYVSKNEGISANETLTRYLCEQ